MVKLAGISLALGSMLLCTTAARADYTNPSLVRAIEQGRSTFFAGATFVSLAAVSCAARTDGFFVLPNDPKQPQQLNLLLTARTNGNRVVVNFVPGTCNLVSVGLCPNTGTC